MVSKVHRAKYGPSLLEVVCAAIIGLVLGVALCFTFLVLKPVQKVKVLPKEKPVYSVFYQEGSRDATRGRQWLRKRQVLVEGGSVALTEDELNTWISGGTPTTKAKSTDATKVQYLEAASPNFRIHNDKLQIGVPCTLNLFGATVEVIAQTDGHFTKKDDSFVFEPEHFYLGSCPLHRFANLGQGVVRKLVKLPETPDDLVAAWKRLSEVSIDGSMLKLTMP